MSEKRCKTGGCWTKSNGDHTGFGCGCDCHQTPQVPTMTDCDRVQRDIAAGKPGKIIMGCSEHGLKCIERKSAGATPDTKQGEGLGEATPRPWTWTPNETEEGEVIGAGMILDANGESIFTIDCDDYFVMSDETSALVVEAVNSFDSLKQRVKVLEEALGKIEEAHCADGCGTIASVALQKTEALAPPVGEKEK